MVLHSRVSPRVDGTVESAVNVYLLASHRRKRLGIPQSKYDIVIGTSFLGDSMNKISFLCLI